METLLQLPVSQVGLGPVGYPVKYFKGACISGTKPTHVLDKGLFEQNVECGVSFMQVDWHAIEASPSQLTAVFVVCVYSQLSVNHGGARFCPNYMVEGTLL